MKELTPHRDKNDYSSNYLFGLLTIILVFFVIIGGIYIFYFRLSSPSSTVSPLEGIGYLDIFVCITKEILPGLALVFVSVVIIDYGPDIFPFIGSNFKLPSRSEIYTRFKRISTITVGFTMYFYLGQKFYSFYMVHLFYPNETLKFKLSKVLELSLCHG